MKKTFLIALTFGLPWTVIMVIYYSLTNDGLSLNVIVSTLIGGLVAGLLFALAMQYTAKKLLTKITVDTEENEWIIKEGAANHFKGMEGVGGKLVLTNKRLIFKSHKLNLQNHQDNFELAQIENLQTSKTLGFLKNGLTLELNGNEKHKFIIDAPQEWVVTILNQKQTL